MKLEKVLPLVIGCFFISLVSPFTPGVAISKEKPIELTVTTWNPAHIDPSRLMVEWSKLVEERSGGKVTFVFFWSSSLAKMEDTFRAIQTGLADIGMWVIGNVSGLTPLNEYISLPFMGFKDSPTVLKVYREMRKRRPELNAEFRGMTYLYGYPMPPYHFHTTEKTIRVPDDLRGMKILADANLSDFLNSLGAVSVTKGPSDWYMSLQKGLVEGQLNHWSIVRAFKLEELFTRHTQAGLAGVSSLMLTWWMNTDTWNRLPPKARETILELQPQFEEKALELSLTLQALGQEGAREANHEIIDLSPEEVQRWVEASEPVRMKWVADMEAQGKPGRAIYEEAKELITQFNQ